MFEMNYAAVTDAHRVLTSQNVMHTFTGLGEMVNLTPAAAPVDYNNRKTHRKLFAARPARPIYRDRVITAR